MDKSFFVVVGYLPKIPTKVRMAAKPYYGHGVNSIILYKLWYYSIYLFYHVINL